MRIYTSYFYMVRFMKSHHIPLSTAVWDPKWFHNFQGQDAMFIDKRGVLNGVRASMFAPDDTCKDLCRGREHCNPPDPDNCMFLRNYSVQLRKMDANKFMEYLQFISDNFTQLLHLDREPVFILLLHEDPHNPCSERWPLQKWFRDAGIEVTEWDKED